MSMPQSVQTAETPSPVPSEEVQGLTPVCGPLNVQSTTNPKVVPVSDAASIERNDVGDELFCLRKSQTLEDDLRVHVRAPEGRADVGPWTSTEPVLCNGVEYWLQVSVVFPGEPSLERLYGAFIPVSSAAAAGRGEYGQTEEEPIVVWGSEDEGSGPDIEES